MLILKSIASSVRPQRANTMAAARSWLARRCATFEIVGVHVNVVSPASRRKTTQPVRSPSDMIKLCSCGRMSGCLLKAAVCKDVELATLDLAAVVCAPAMIDFKANSEICRRRIIMRDDNVEVVSDITKPPCRAQSCQGQKCSCCPKL